MSPSRFSAGMTSGSPRRRDQQREGRVDQLRLVRHVRVARRGRVHLLLEHPLVDRADRVLRAAEDLRAGALGLAERELGDRAADAALDPLGAERDLVVALALAPLLRAVGVADRHAHDRDRRVDAAERDDARDAPAGADDHLAADLLAEDPVRRADVVAALGRDRRRLQAEAVPRAIAAAASYTTRFCGRAAVLERQVEAREARARRRSRPARARAAPPRAAPARSRPPRARRSWSGPRRGFCQAARASKGASSPERDRSRGLDGALGRRLAEIDVTAGVERAGDRLRVVLLGVVLTADPEEPAVEQPDGPREHALPRRARAAADGGSSPRAAAAAPRRTRASGRTSPGRAAPASDRGSGTACGRGRRCLPPGCGRSATGRSRRPPRPAGSSSSRIRSSVSTCRDPAARRVVDVRESAAAAHLADSRPSSRRGGDGALHAASPNLVGRKRAHGSSCARNPDSIAVEHFR